MRVPNDPKSHLAFVKQRLVELREQYLDPKKHGRTRQGIILEQAQRKRMQEKLERKLGIPSSLIQD